MVDLEASQTLVYSKTSLVKPIQVLVYLVTVKLLMPVNQDALMQLDSGVMVI